MNMQTSALKNARATCLRRAIGQAPLFADKPARFLVQTSGLETIIGRRRRRLSEVNMENEVVERVLITALRTAGAGPAGVDRPTLAMAIQEASDRQLADALLSYLREAEGAGLDWQFIRLISASVAIYRDGLERGEKDANFAWAMKLLKSNEARVELRISFGRSPGVIGELIRDEDGERIGVLFELQGRTPFAH